MSSSRHGLSNFDQAAIAEAEARLKGMADQFVQWLAADLDTIACLLERMGKSDSIEKSDIQQLFSLLHNIKGQAGSFDYSLITEVGGIACDLVRDRDTVSDDVLAVVDRCRHAMQTISCRRITGDGGKKGAELVKRLRDNAASVA